jgi:hypothetical protein
MKFEMDNGVWIPKELQAQPLFVAGDPTAPIAEERLRLLDELPDGLLRRDQLPMLSQWFVDIDFELYKHEIEQLPNTPEGRLIVDCMRAAASIEDATVTDYIRQLLATDINTNDEVRRLFLINKWVPEEFTHGTNNHLIVDIAEGRMISGRGERNEHARQQISLRDRLGDMAVRHLIGPTEPEFLALIGDFFGMANEPRPQFLYLWCRDTAKELGLPLLAAAFNQQKKDEGVHGGQYHQSIVAKMEDYPDVISELKWWSRKKAERMVSILASYRKQVGSERTAQQDILLLGSVFDTNNSEHIKFMDDHDDKFSRLRYMDGIMPFRATLLMQRPGVELAPNQFTTAA